MEAKKGVFGLAKKGRGFSLAINGKAQNGGMEGTGDGGKRKGRHGRDWRRRKAEREGW